MKGYRCAFYFPVSLRIRFDEGSKGGRGREGEGGDIFSRDGKLFSFASRAISASHSQQKCQLTSRSLNYADVSGFPPEGGTPRRSGVQFVFRELWGTSRD